MFRARLPGQGGKKPPRDRDGDAPRSVPLPSGTTSFWPTAFHVIFKPSVESLRCLRLRFARPGPRCRL